MTKHLVCIMQNIDFLTLLMGGGRFCPPFFIFAITFERTDFLTPTLCKFSQNLLRNALKHILGPKFFCRSRYMGLFTKEAKFSIFSCEFFSTFFINSCIYKVIYQYSLPKGTFWGVKHQNQTVNKDFRRKIQFCLFPGSRGEPQIASTSNGHITG